MSDSRNSLFAFECPGLLVSVRNAAEAAVALSAARVKAADQLARAVNGELGPLKLERAKFSAQIDSDEDGRIDRWEEYGADGALTVARIARAKQGTPDQIIYMKAGGDVDRIEYLEVSDVTGKEGVVRREFFERGQRIRAEEDADGDGLMDRWEHYDAAGAQIAVEFDTIQPYTGKPNRRMNYSPSGELLSIETEPDGAGGYLKKTIPGKKKD